jgi:hypothetical protein
LMLNLTAQFLFGILLWLLTLTSISTAKAESIEIVDTSDRSVYFPRHGELRRCLVTSPDNCVFENNIFPAIPSVAKDLSLDYRKSAFLAEISIKLAVIDEYNHAKELTQLITHPAPRIFALTAIAAQQAKTQQIDQAQQTLAKATQIAQTGYSQFSGSSRTRALTQIAVQYAAIGQQEISDQFFDLALPDRSEFGV